MELSETEKQALMFKGLCNIRANAHMVNIIEKMFDCDLEVSDLENDLFSIQEKLELIFNFLDLFFYLYECPNDPMFTSLLKKMNNLQRYYDTKATLNMHHDHSETIIEFFRFCIRKDKILSVALKRDFEGFDFARALQTSEIDEATLDSLEVNGCVAKSYLHPNLKQHWTVQKGMVRTSLMNS